jgi:DNA polymerase III gamma/tau subunit
MEKEDIVNLENLASQTPWNGGNKTVIIIDEIQSLGKSSKEATLNLLEKKRKDTIFILCTMDVSKIDKAILSRGQVFKFKPLSQSEIGTAIIKNLEILDPEEKLPINPSVLVTISQNSYGSIRQAQQYLQRIVDSELFTDDLVESELGFFSEEKGYSIFNRLLVKDTSFFQSIASVKSEDFYIYSWAILSSVQKTLRTLDKEDFKYKSSYEIANSPNYKELCDTYLNINRDTGNWFREHIYNYYIGEYMKNDAPALVRVRQKKLD